MELTYENGDQYLGSYENGLKNGHGIVKNEVGTHEGKFLNDLAHGPATIDYKNGDIFKGYYKNGLIHGKGTLIRRKGKEVFKG